MILTCFVSKRILTFKTVGHTLAFPESYGQFIAFMYQHLSALKNSDQPTQTTPQTKSPNNILCLLRKIRNEKH